MEKVKPGSARRGTLRVPRDQVAKTNRKAAGRIRVKGMDFTAEQAGSKLDKGLGDVAKKGSKAGSTLRTRSHRSRRRAVAASAVTSGGRTST